MAREWEVEDEVVDEVVDRVERDDRSADMVEKWDRME